MDGRGGESYLRNEHKQKVGVGLNEKQMGYVREGLNEKQMGDLIQQVDEMMDVAKSGEYEKENRKYLVVVDQNMMRNTLGECFDAESKSGGKWKGIQRASQDKMGQRIEGNKENLEMRNQKRGHRIKEGLQKVGNDKTRKENEGTR